MMRSLQLLLTRELLIERRTWSWLGSMGVLALISVFVLALGFFPEPAGEVKSALTAAGFWLVILFSGSVGVSRAFAQERMSGALQGLRVLPLESGLLYVAKVTMGMLSMLVVCVAMLVAAALFLESGFGEIIFSLLPILGLTSLGYVAVGTVLAAMTSSLQGRDALLAVALFPIVLPLFLLATGASRDLLLGASLSDVQDELVMLAAFDAIYLALGMLSFGPVLDS